MALKPVKGKIESQELNDNFSYLDTRVDEIITTPAEGISEQEIIDARGGEVSLGARLRNPNNRIKFPYFSDDTFDLDFLWDDKTVIASANVKNNPFGTGCEVIAFRGKTNDNKTGRVWITQIAVSYGAAGILGESKIRYVIGNETTNELVDKSDWSTLGISTVTADMLDKNYTFKEYYSNDTYNLDDAIEEGNYLVNKSAENNPFNSGCAVKVSSFKLNLETNQSWIVQDATNYGSETNRGKRVWRVLIFDSSGELREKTEWRGNYRPPVKILSISNSFGLDATKYIPEIAKSINENIITCNLYISGGLISDHDDNIKNNNNPYRIYNRYYVNGVITDDYVANKTIDDALSLHEYDYVIFNQSSNMSGVYDTFQPYLNDIIDYVKSKQPNIKVALMPTWAYSSDFDDTRFDKYDRDQKTMFNAILDAYKQSMNDVDFDVIIPVGTAIQNGRTDDYLKSLDRELTRDGYHLGDTGCFIAGITFFKLFFGDVKIDWKPSSINKRAAYFANVAANNALLNPFKITEI